MQIAHLSDPHLMRGPLAALPAANLAEAIGRVLAIEPRPDCIVITGDLADTGHPEEYAALRTILRRCPIPVHLMAGNHDEPAALIAKFGDTPFLGHGVSTSYVVEYPEAIVVVANSWLQGSPAGYLGPAQLAWIDQALGARPDVPAFVCLHHPPVPVGIPFLDGMLLNDAAEFAEVIRRRPHVARVLAGHVHRDVSALFAGTLLTIAPSTYLQSALRQRDAGPPGYLAEPTSFLLHVIDGTHCVTHSVAISHASAVRSFLPGIPALRESPRHGGRAAFSIITRARCRAERGRGSLRPWRFLRIDGRIWRVPVGAPIDPAHLPVLWLRSTAPGAGF